MTQRQKVLNYMMRNGAITTASAFTRLGITRLAARIYDLQTMDGIKIQKSRVSYKAADGTRKHYDVYRLAEDQGK